MRNVNNIEQQLREDEGEKLAVYTDSEGFATISVGVLIDARKGGGITKEESDLLFQNRLNAKRAELVKRLPWVVKLDSARFGVLLNMAYQMGVDGLLEFKNTLRYVQAGNYLKASDEMLDSLWARQTPNRAKRLSRQMEAGEWQ